MLRSNHPDWDFFKIDADNAFNRANRFSGLLDIMEKFPAASNFLNQMYLNDSHQIFCHDGVLSIIVSETGFHQGDVLGSWAFMITIHRLLEGLMARIEERFPVGGAGLTSESFLALFYVDDGYMCGPPEILTEAILHLRSNGARFGYHMNESKGVLQLGLRDSAREAIDSANVYSIAPGLSINDNVIQVHPANVIEAKELGIINDLPGSYKSWIENDDAFDPNTVYGFKVLGSYIGSDAYIKANLAKTMEEWNIVKDELIRFPIAQQRMLLFRSCFSPKPVHLLRTIPTHLTEELVSTFCRMQCEILESMFAQSLDSLSMKIFCLPVNKGGLGILNYQTIHSIAHIASVLGLPFFRDMFKQRAALQEEDGIQDLQTVFGDFGLALVQRLQGFW